MDTSVYIPNEASSQSLFTVVLNLCMNRMYLTSNVNLYFFGFKKLLMRRTSVIIMALQR